MKTTLQRLALVALLIPTVGSAAAAQSRPGSIYNPDLGPFGLAADKIARRPGDLVTVIVNESLDVENAETSNLTKATSLDYQLESFDIRPDAFSILPNVTASSQDDFQGTANYQKSGTFTARITAIVMDVLPNGNLVIQGRREIRVDYEVKVIEFSGVVRRYDVDKNNSVQSELVADARLIYHGEGPLTNGTNRFGLGRLLHIAIAWLWPF